MSIIKKQTFSAPSENSKSMIYKDLPRSSPVVWDRLVSVRQAIVVQLQVCCTVAFIPPESDAAASNYPKSKKSCLHQ